MTTTVHVTACADKGKRVRVKLSSHPSDQFLAAGEQGHFAIYDSHTIEVSEENVPEPTEQE